MAMKVPVRPTPALQEQQKHLENSENIRRQTEGSFLTKQPTCSGPPWVRYAWPRGQSSVARIE